MSERLDSVLIFFCLTAQSSVASVARLIKIREEIDDFLN